MLKIMTNIKIEKAVEKIVKDENDPESMELMAKSVIQISDAFDEIQKNGMLKQRTIILLLHDLIGVNKINKTQIALVLDNLPRLKAWYIKDTK